jgi:FAD/FMN-containing dehydrogenase
MQNLIPPLSLLSGFKGEIEIDEPTLKKYSRDASIFEIKPQAVLRPKNVEDIKILVKWINDQKNAYPNLSITARSAGTDMSGGAIGEGIILDFVSHINKLEMFGSNSVVVEPGMYYRDFETETLKRGLILPCYTASKSLNTVGGMAANNSAGEKSLAYGQTKDYVEELNVVLSDGNEYVFGELDEHGLEQKMKLTGFEGDIYRQTFRLIKDNYEVIKNAKPTTSKNSAGYLLWEVCPDTKTEKKDDRLNKHITKHQLNKLIKPESFGAGVYNGVKFNLAKLFVGSQGTLGLITKIKYKLVKPKPKSELLVIFLRRLDNLGEVVDAVVKHKPESFESFDDNTFKLAMKFLFPMIKKMSREAGSRSAGLLSLAKLGLQFLPEVWMTLTGGVPKLILIAEFTGESEEEVYQKILIAEKEVIARFRLKTHITKNASEAEKYWTVRRESFSLLREHSAGLSTAPFVDDIVVHPNQLPQFLPELNAIFAKYPSLIYTIAGHAGDANFHIIPLMDLTKADQRAIIPILADEVYDLVLKYKGSITAEHNDGLIRSPYLEKQFGKEVVDLFAQVKQIFDPKNIFNPGKKVGSSLQYALDHIKKTL